LVGRDLEQGLVDGDLVTDGLEPACDGAFRDGLAERWHRDGLAVACPARVLRLLWPSLGLGRRRCFVRGGLVLGGLVLSGRCFVLGSLVLGGLVLRGLILGRLLLRLGVTGAAALARADDREVG